MLRGKSPKDEPRYRYADVQRYTRKADLGGAGLLGIDVWLIPIHIPDSHWALAALDVRDRVLHYYDSLALECGKGGFGAAVVPGKPLTADEEGDDEDSGCNASRVTLQAILQWWSDDTADKLGETRRVDTRNWPIRRYSSSEIPTQSNVVDCGFFVMNYARCLAEGHEWDFSQADIPDLRKQTVLRVLEAGPLGSPPPL